MENQREVYKAPSRNKYIHTVFNILIPTLVITLVIIMVTNYGKHREKITLEYGDYMIDQISKSMADEISMTLDYGRSSILNVAASVAAKGKLEELLENPAEHIEPLIKHSPFKSIEYIRADGMNVMNIGDPFDASRRPYYIEGMKGNSGIWNNYNPKHSKEVLINFYTPLIYQNENQGVITGYIEATSQLASILKKDFFSEPAYSILYDKDEKVIASSLGLNYEPEMTLKILFGLFGSDSEVIDNYISILGNDSEGVIKFVNDNGEGRLCVKAVPDTDWKVAVFISAMSFKKIYGKDMRYSLVTILNISILLILYLMHVVAMKAKETHIIKKENSTLELINQKFSDENKKTYAELEKLNLKLKIALENGARYVTEMIRYASSEADADKILNQLIEYIGKNTKSDGVYLFEKIDDTHYGNTYEWCADGIPKRQESLQNFPIDGSVNVWLEEFRTHGMIIIANLEDYKSVNESIYNYLKSLDIKNIAAVPLLVNEQIIGFVSVENPQADDIRNVAGFLNLVEFFFTMMMRLRDNVKLLQESAICDQLTGCKNRKALVWAFDGDYNKEESMAVIAIDMNGLKQINDNLGHDAGDEYICNTSQLLCDSFGKENVYRMGGDEFLAVLTGKSQSEVDMLVEQYKVKAGKIVSLGYVFVEKAVDSFDAMMKKADFYMYEAKTRFYRENKDSDRRR